MYITAVCPGSARREASARWRGVEAAVQGSLRRKNGLGSLTSEAFCRWDGGGTALPGLSALTVYSPGSPMGRLLREVTADGRLGKGSGLRSTYRRRGLGCS